MRREGGPRLRGEGDGGRYAVVCRMPGLRQPALLVLAHEVVVVQCRPGRVHAGDLVGIIGPNGAGKSTILEAITWAMYGGTALRGTNAKFERRFAYIERALAAKGRSLEDATLPQVSTFREAYLDIVKF